MSEVNTKVCFCGCGGTTKSRFVPGHDARFHSWAKQVLRGKRDAETTLASLPHDAAREEFLAFSDLQQPKEDARERKEAAKKAAQAAQAAKKAADELEEETAEDEEEEATEVVAEREATSTALALVS